MNITPDDQLLVEPCTKAIDALEEVIKSIKARLFSEGVWKESHLLEIQVLLHQVVDIQLRLHRIANES